MEILLTGGTGFLGRALCASLIGKGHRLTVLSRRPLSVPEICGEGVAGVASFSELGGRRFDAAINLAGEPILGRRWSEARKRKIWQSRIGVTAALVDYLANHPVDVLLSGSAVGYYGNRKSECLSETSQHGSPAEFGVRLCVAWEEEALRARANRICLVRCGIVIGPGGGFLSRMLPLFKMGLGGRHGSGTQWFSWVHLEDYVAMMLRLLSSPTLSGPFNAVSPNPVTNAEFTAGLAKTLGRPARFALPEPFLRLLLGESAELLTGGQRVYPEKFLEAGFDFKHPLLAEALAAAME